MGLDWIGKTWIRGRSIEGLMEESVFLMEQS